MLNYIMTLEEAKLKKLNTNANTLYIQEAGKKRPDKWVKVWMNGSDVPFFVLCRK